MILLSLLLNLYFRTCQSLFAKTQLRGHLQLSEGDGEETVSSSG